MEFCFSVLLVLKKMYISTMYCKTQIALFMENEEKRTWETPELTDLDIEDGTSNIKVGPGIDVASSSSSS